MLQGYLKAMRSDQFFDRFCRLLDGVSRLGQSAVEVGKFLANSVHELGVRKPGNIVKISGDPRRLLHVVSDNDSRAGLEFVADLVEKTGFGELVGASLQIGATHLGAEGEAGQRYRLCFGKMFLPIHANFAQRCRCRPRCLRGYRIGRCEKEQHEKRGIPSKKTSHRFILAETTVDYSTVTDFARLRGCSTSQPRRTAM